MDNKGKEGSWTPMIIALIVSMIIATQWDKWPWLSGSIKSVLNPSLGWILNWNLDLGMFIIVAVVAIITTLAQKYLTDQKTLKEMKAEQKKLQQEMKQFEIGSEKHKEHQLKTMEFMGPMMKLSMRPVMYTAVPFILLFRWFGDYFTILGSTKVLGMHWLLFYLLGSIIVSSIIRKVLKVA